MTDSSINFLWRMQSESSRLPTSSGRLLSLLALYWEFSHNLSFGCFLWATAFSVSVLIRAQTESFYLPSSSAWLLSLLASSWKFNQDFLLWLPRLDDCFLCWFLITKSIRVVLSSCFLWSIDFSNSFSIIIQWETSRLAALGDFLQRRQLERVLWLDS